MSLKGMNILVTGAGGFIASHLAEELVKIGGKVTAFVKYNSRNDWGLIEDLSDEVRSKIEIVAGDLKDSDAVREACKGKDVVFHLGALIAIPYSYVHPRDHVETNVIGTLNVMTGAKEGGVGMVVHTSTSEVYGTALYTPIDETHPLQAQSPYAASKIAADKIAESFYLSSKLPVVTLRPFNTYGPRQSGRAVIPTIISQALTGEKIRLGSLEPRRDLTYVKDTIKGFILAAEKMEVVGEVINLGAEKNISIGELAKKINEIIGKNCEIIQDERRLRPTSSEVMELMASAEKARKILGWKPETPLNDGLKSTIQYIDSNISKYKTHIFNI